MNEKKTDLVQQLVLYSFPVILTPTLYFPRSWQIMR